MVREKALKGYVSVKWVGGALLVLLVTALVLSVAVACDQVEPGDPVLPDGFRAAQIPDASVKAYVYLKPKEPLSVSVERFLDGEGAGLPSEAGISLWTVWVGPIPKDFGMGFQFVDLSVLDAVVKELEGGAGSWDHLRKGEWLYLFDGDVEWVEALKSSLEGGRFVRLEDAYPDEWEMIRLLPETPPGDVIGAGFGKLDEEFLAGLGEQVGGIGSDVQSLVDAVNIKSAVFGLYAYEMPAEMPEFGEDFLEEMGLSGLIVTKTGYPGFIINFIFGRAASGAGLEKMDMKGGDAYYKALQESLHVLIKNIGSIFYVAVASETDSARALMESVLAD